MSEDRREKSAKKVENYANVSIWLGPVEIEETRGIYWSANDWPSYIKCPYNSSVSDLTLIMQDGWKMKKPQIMVSLLSQYGALEWDNHVQIDKFLKGLVKAASSSSMWIVTNGIDVGISHRVAEAVAKERKWHKSKGSQSALDVVKCIGVVRSDRLLGDPLLTSHRQLKTIEASQGFGAFSVFATNDQSSRKRKFNIDQDHTHFVFVSDEAGHRLEQHLAFDLLDELTSEEAWPHDFNTERPREAGYADGEVPLVGILIEGDEESASAVASYLIRQRPVVVLKGSGGFADLLSYAYQELPIESKQEGLWDMDFLEEHLKPHLSKKILHVFPEYRHNTPATKRFRNQIIICLKNALQNNVEYLTILDTYSASVDLQGLSATLLEAYFTSKDLNRRKNMHGSEERRKLLNALKIMLDWNTPILAASYLFKGQYQLSIPAKVFLEALTSPKEDFVEIFLEAGFQLRKLYNTEHLQRLVENALEAEFFVEVCCRGILGISHFIGNSPTDWLRYLNSLIYKTTSLRNFLHYDDLTHRLESTGSCMEQKCLTFLTMWSVFTNRTKLVAKLWRFHSHPINMCLVVSKMLAAMSIHAVDVETRNQMETSSREYGCLATRTLDACYQATPVRAMKLLALESSHWSNQSAIAIAASTENHEFVSHASCQRYLSAQFMNHIHFKKFDSSILVLPRGAKIILAAIFVFPIYSFFDFPEQTANTVGYRNKDSVPICGDKSNQRKTSQKQFSDAPQGVALANPTRFRQVTAVDLSLGQKWLILWNATVTKYWFHHIFFLSFLAYLSYYVVVMTCKYTNNDLLVFLWISLHLAEDIRMAYSSVRNKITKSRSIYTSLEIPLTFLFLILFYFARIAFVPPFYNHQYLAKMMICALLYNYYFRYLAVFVPISSIFGPFFYVMKHMMITDFLQFLIVWTPLMIGNTIVIRASFYPDQDIFQHEPFLNTFHYGFFTLFTLWTTELERQTEHCKARAGASDVRGTFCLIGSYFDSNCYNQGFWPTLFVAVYLILMKLLLINILYALFFGRLGKMNPSNIWMYQRFFLINHFNCYSTFPPPLTPITYIYWLLSWFCSLCRTLPKLSKSAPSNCLECPTEELRHFSMITSKKAAKKIEQSLKAETNFMQLIFRSQLISENMDYLNVQASKLSRRALYLQKKLLEVKATTESYSYTEEQKITGAWHIYARTSPYPDTGIMRFPVPSKRIPWEVVWTDYDPPFCSGTKRSFRDEDFPDDIRLEDEYGKKRLNVELTYNEIFKFHELLIDRRSWVRDKTGKYLKYKIDGVYPLNIIGRTGIAGRGSLPRWGPNHHLVVLVTKYLQSSKNHLQVLVSNTRKEPKLIGCFAANEPMYESLRQKFTKSSTWKSSEEMIDFFKKHVAIQSSSPTKLVKKIGISSDRSPPVVKLHKSNLRLELEIETTAAEDFMHFPPVGMTEVPGLQYGVVQRGYWDSVYNTDNAWREVEFWHLHYTKDDTLNRTFEKNFFHWLPLDHALLESLSSDEKTLLRSYQKYWLLTDETP